ncbi:NADH-quinone oxidoreductase subunit A [Myxococcota bacterium]|nr:NADH-quinone oxidoreductase subunit A [Myxococcota bacterium]MBU1898106.1 NADH-quinone oxidoreductase subunit A [Myxococcota bacterium]
MPFDFAVVLIFLAVSAGFVWAAMFVGKLVRPHRPDAQKLQTYECGERPIGAAWYNFNPRFYLLALVFIIFDVEIALTFPVGVVARAWVEAGHGLTVVVEILLFVAVLVAALAYVWGRGDLNWVRDLEHEAPLPPVEPPPDAALTREVHS